MNLDFKKLNARLKRKKPFSDKKKVIFYNDLSILISAGLEIKTSLEIISGSYTKKRDKDVINHIIENLVQGYTLSDAMRATYCFSVYENSIIKIGEETGYLKEVLCELYEFLRNKIEQKKKMLSTFSYPIIVLLTTVLVLAFMLNFIVPLFSDVFNQLGNDLPQLTQWIIALSSFFSQYFVLLLIPFLAGFIFFQFFKEHPFFRYFLSNTLLKIPLFGELLRKLLMARICLGFALLTGAKVPLIEAIHLMKEIVNFYPIEKSFLQIEKDILWGKPLSQAMQDFPIYDKRMISLIKVGEEVNKLDLMFSRLKDQYNSEINHQISMISTIMEPFLIIFIGGVVTLVLIAMYLPMFKMSGGMGL